jgi:hypothetical protein
MNLAATAPPMKKSGVYYGFMSEPTVLTLAEAFEQGYYNDAVFSLIAGKAAIHFHHEGWIWYCRR